MEPQLKRGILDASILSVLAAGDSYGYQIIKDAPEALELTESTLYPILRRLEKAGFVREYKQEHSGRLRKYYSLTKDGRAYLRRFADERQAIDAVLDFITQGAQS